ncbi:MAG: hypothetical protein AAB657_02170 [Patescibacteria group bacterium]
MSDSLINTISRLASRPEKFVVILPSGEAVVLVSLQEYEKLTSEKSGVAVNNQKNVKNPTEQSLPFGQMTKASQTVEAIDPLTSGLSDDDQFFPEPIE